MSVAPTAFGRGAPVYLDNHPIIDLTEATTGIRALPAGMQRVQL